MRSHPFLTIFLGLSVIGTLVSLVAHVLTFFGILFSPDGLFVGAFVLYVPALLVARPESSEFGLRVSFADAFRGGPDWARNTSMVLLAYAVAHLVFGGVSRTNLPATPQSARGWLALTMAFYSVAAAMFLAALYRAHTEWRPDP